MSAMLGAGGTVTVTLVVPTTPPEVAVIWVVPGPTAVTTLDDPLGATVATLGALLAQVTVGAAMIPVLPTTDAVRVALCPRALNATVAGAIDTEITVDGVDGGVAGASLPPQA